MVLIYKIWDNTYGLHVLQLTAIWLWDTYTNTCSFIKSRWHPHALPLWIIFSCKKFYLLCCLTKVDSHYMYTPSFVQDTFQQGNIDLSYQSWSLSDIYTLALILKLPNNSGKKSKINANILCKIFTSNCTQIKIKVVGFCHINSKQLVMADSSVYIPCSQYVTNL